MKKDGFILPKLHFVLVEPRIPQNTGSIARTCAVTGAALHLIHPLGFRIDDAKLKRAGLDYWDKLDIFHYQNLDDFFAKNEVSCMRLFSTKAPRSYAEADYPILEGGDYGCKVITRSELNERARPIGF